MVPGSYNGVYNNNVLEDNLFNILNPIVTRIAIENRRQKGILENLNKEYQKNKSPEFLNGIVTTKSAIKLIEVQVKNIEDLSRAINNINNATNETFNQIANDINVAYAKVCNYYGNNKLRLTDKEKEDLRVSISNYVSNKKKDLNSKSTLENKSNNLVNTKSSSDKKRDFDIINNATKKKNPLKTALAKFGIKEKNDKDDIMMVDYNNTSRGR